MKIRFEHPASARMEFQRGDEVIVKTMTPALKALVTEARLDGVRVARLVGDDEDDAEVADLDRSDAETTTLGRGRKHAQRQETVSSR